MLKNNLHNVALEKQHCFGGRKTEYKYRSRQLQVAYATGQLSRACSLKCTAASLISRAVPDCGSFKWIPKIKEKKGIAVSNNNWHNLFWDNKKMFLLGMVS